jgi:hypothetical protein
VRVVKAADALRPGGTLATVTTHHVTGGDKAFFAEAQRAMSGGTRTPLTTGRRSGPRPTSRPPATSSNGPDGSVRRRSAATSGSCRTRPAATSTSSSPTRATGPSTRRLRPACSTASPA